MATRFYHPSTPVPAISPAYKAGYSDTTTAERRSLVRVPVASAFATDTTAVGTGNTTHLLRQYVSEPLPAQTLSGTFTGILKAWVSSSSGGYLFCNVRAWSGDGLTLRGEMLAALSAGTLDTTPKTKVFPVTALTATTILAGDVVVIEYYIKFPSVVWGSPTGNAQFGDNGASDYTTSGQTTNLNSFAEFSQDFLTTKPRRSRMYLLE